MAIDAIYLSLLKNELEEEVLGGRIEKIHQISKEELIFTFRGMKGGKRVYFSTRSNSARVHITEYKYENPKTPPMFCMLLRKHLTNGKLVSITQPKEERILIFGIESANEIGDILSFQLIVEVMGRHSNILLVQEGIILDAIKRVDPCMSRVRPILPNRPYTAPPVQERKGWEASGEDLVEEIKKKSGTISKGLGQTIGGISGINCEKLLEECGVENTLIQDTIPSSWDKLNTGWERLKKEAYFNKRNPCILFDEEGNFVDFSSFPLSCQKGEIKQFPNLSVLLDYYYVQRDNVERFKQRSGNLIQFLSNALNRLEKKEKIMEEELALCGERDILKKKGDILQGNLYALKKGLEEVELDDYELEGGGKIKIALTPHLTPKENMQKYYQRYKKTYVAEKYLIQQMKEGREDRAYLESVLDSISRATGDSEIVEIQEELMEAGYLKKEKSKGKKKKKKELSCLSYCTEDGFLVLVGKNNLQNEELSLRKGKKEDIWFHVQGMPGSHVVLVTQGKEVPTSSYIQGGKIAAYHSKGRKSSKVPVDYTQIKYLKKPANGKLGMVIYHVYQTMYVTPIEEEIEQLKR